MFLNKFRHHECLHWFLHRLTAIFLFISFYLSLSADAGIFSFYILNIVLIFVVVVSHFRFGIQTLIDDYQHEKLLNLFSITLLRFCCIFSVKSLFFLQSFIL